MGTWWLSGLPSSLRISTKLWPGLPHGPINGPHSNNMLLQGVIIAYGDHAHQSFPAVLGGELHDEKGTGCMYKILSHHAVM